MVYERKDEWLLKKAKEYAVKIKLYHGYSKEEAEKYASTVTMKRTGNTVDYYADESLFPVLKLGERRMKEADVYERITLKILDQKHLLPLLMGIDITLDSLISVEFRKT